MQGCRGSIFLKPEEGLWGTVGVVPDLEEVAEKTMEGYQRRADDFGRVVEISCFSLILFVLLPIQNS